MKRPERYIKRHIIVRCYGPVVLEGDDLHAIDNMKSIAEGEKCKTEKWITEQFPVDPIRKRAKESAK